VLLCGPARTLPPCYSSFWALIFRNHTPDSHPSCTRSRGASGNGYLADICHSVSQSYRSTSQPRRARLVACLGLRDGQVAHTHSHLLYLALANHHSIPRIRQQPHQLTAIVLIQRRLSGCERKLQRCRDTRWHWCCDESALNAISQSARTLPRPKP